MKLDIKYNKTALREFQKKLQVRERALPTLKNKEAAFRAMVLEVKRELGTAEKICTGIFERISPWKNMWQEYNQGLVNIKEVRSQTTKIAGITIPEFESIEFELPSFNLASNPTWFSEGTKVLNELLETGVKLEFLKNKLDLLEQARKKATQKVNLYEKVQIPALSSAIKHIKRYLEDEENLSKAGQKLLKQKLEKAQEL